MTPQDVANAKRDRMSKKRFAFPYGDTSFIAGTNQKEVKLKEYRYTVKEKDDATGLYYYGARYYASWLARWLSADPLFRENPAVYEGPKPKDKDEAKKQEEDYRQKLYSEGLNLYGYVKGNPVNHNDPTGMEEKYNPSCHQSYIPSVGEAVESRLKRENNETVKAVKNFSF